MNSSDQLKSSQRPHVPVMPKEILEHLLPVLNSVEGPRYLDGTLGRGGHLRLMFDHCPQLTAIAFDQDPEAIAYAQEMFKSEIQQGRLQWFVRCDAVGLRSQFTPTRRWS